MSQWKKCCHTCQYHKTTMTDESIEKFKKYREAQIKRIEQIEKLNLTPTESLEKLNSRDGFLKEPEAEWIGYCSIWDKYFKDYQTHFCERYKLGDHVWNW